MSGFLFVCFLNALYRIQKMANLSLFSYLKKKKFVVVVFVFLIFRLAKSPDQKTTVSESKDFGIREIDSVTYQLFELE